MKKKTTKKLVLKKKTVTNLTDNEMKLTKGATLLAFCTNSCSLMAICCPTTEENVIEQLPDEGQG